MDWRMTQTIIIRLERPDSGLIVASSMDFSWYYLVFAAAVFMLGFLGCKKKNTQYKQEYSAWKHMHDHGFFCHRCGNAFTG